MVMSEKTRLTPNLPRQPMLIPWLSKVLIHEGGYKVLLLLQCQGPLKIREALKLTFWDGFNWMLRWKEVGHLLRHKTPFKNSVRFSRNSKMSEYTTNPTECRMSSVECQVSVKCPSSVRRVSVECPPNDVECPSSVHSVWIPLSNVTRWTLDGHSTDTRWTLDGHSALGTRRDWWCTVLTESKLTAVNWFFVRTVDKFQIPEYTKVSIFEFSKDMVQFLQGFCTSTYFIWPL